MNGISARAQLASGGGGDPGEGRIQHGSRGKDDRVLRKIAEADRESYAVDRLPENADLVVG